MLERAVLALADHRRPRQHHGQQADLVDDRDDALEPGRDRVRIEQLPDHQLDRLLGRDVGALQIRRHAIVDDVLDVARADAGLLHRRRVDVHLDGRAPARAQVVLEHGRDEDDEHQEDPRHE